MLQEYNALINMGQWGIKYIKLVICSEITNLESRGNATSQI